MRPIFAIVTFAVFLCASVVKAEEQTVRAATMTREQFEALSPDAMIDFNGPKMTKREFAARQQKAAEDAARMIVEMREHNKDQFEAFVRRKLDFDKARLAEANKRVQAEVERLRSADAAARRPDWEARKKKAFELLGQAFKLQQEAADLLAPTK